MYTKVLSGNAPVILSIPHDGERMLPGVPYTNESLNWFREGHDGRDYGTEACAHACQAAMKIAGRSPTLIFFEVLRSQIDVNRDPGREPYVIDGKHAVFSRAEYAAFHATLEVEVKRNLTDYGYCLLVDLHSFAQFWMDGADIVLGTKEGRLCPMDWSELLFQSLSKHRHPVLRREYRVTYSPDRTKGVGGALSGGYVVRRAITTFPSDRDARRLGGIQIEVRRQPFFLEHPNAVGAHLADALLDWLSKMT